MDKKLYRSQTEKILGGVAGGLGEYFEVDPTIVRLIFILITLFGGSGLLLYLILWILIPGNPEDKMALDKERVKEVAEEIKDKAEEIGKEIKEGVKDLKGKEETTKPEEKTKKRSGGLFGWILIIVGILFLLNTLYPSWLRFYFSNFWSVILIIVGIFLIIRSSRK